MSRIRKSILNLLLFVTLIILIIDIFYIKTCIIKAHSLEDINVDNYYYNQLLVEEKNIYDALISSKEDIMDNKELIYLGKISLGKPNLEDEYVCEVVNSVFSKVMWAYRLDNPMSTLWLSTYTRGISIIKSDESLDTIVKLYISPKENSFYAFESKEELLGAINQIETKTQEFVNSLSGTDEEKLQSIHDWLINDTKYNEVNNPHMNDLYGCIMKKETVCGGFTYSMKYVADMAKIPVLSVFGSTVNYDKFKKLYIENHAWNIIYIDKEWYLSDLTRDCYMKNKNGNPYIYFKLSIDTYGYYEEIFELPQ